MGSAWTDRTPRPLETPRKGRVVGVGLGLVLTLSGCSGGSDGDGAGPASLSDGAYRLLATSASQVPDPTVQLQITGDTIVLTHGAGTVQGILGPAGPDEYVLCPPDGTGSPRPLGSPVEVGEVRLASPGLFGDCGQTTPVRVTLVDLSATTDQAFPFQSWAEFCDTTDPDC